ncbi:bifunctional 4-hydroxy-2-oxoglutarate aldolase/2-dehydro-3-deoxy-phosphogluconate aldolase [Pontibacillus salicampi]|uniref:Bifunctional 4-hydroxy-2-oxoglutarate aldolase/2-dehydro-3-deoxy-phosphogluconate aldolase n=1 Tax=Pontibacillus salicampi TaxID=1449801 RepID=A0ABV6LQI3_9BACI
MVILQRLCEEKIVAVLRKADESTIIPVVRALRSGGIHAIEVTAETPRVTRLIEMVREEFEEDVLIGAGTVLDSETARATLMAGAQFVVTPTVKKETINLCNRYGVPCISGALTPTEILTAYEHGADMIKVFPASSVGPDYVKNVHGPLPHIPIMVTGGIDGSNMVDYLQAGAKVVGVGGKLVKPENISVNSDTRSITNKAKEFVSIARGEHVTQS